MSVALKSSFQHSSHILNATKLPSIVIKLPQLNPFFQKFSAVIEQSLQDIGILWAAPKKRPSKSRTRINFLSAGSKQIKHMTNLVRCPACGHFKRAHFMCMNCFAEIRDFLKRLKREKSPETSEQQANLDPVDERILYPGKYLTQEEMKLKAKEWVPKREKPLEYSLEHIAKKTRKDYLK